MSVPEDGAGGQPTVVLVEDDVALRDALRFAFEIEGWLVLVGGSGEDLLALPLPLGRFCIVSDLRLPGMTGIEALQQLRRRGVDEPAILITGPPSAAERRAAGKVRARFVEKPLVSDELLSVVREVLA